MRVIYNYLGKKTKKKSIKNKSLIIPTLNLIIDNIFKAFPPRSHVVFLFKKITTIDI